MADPRDDTGPLGSARAYPEPQGLERRIDPDDGVAYTFDEYRQACSELYEDGEIIAYWFDNMTVELPEGTRLFVDNISTEVSDEELRDVFGSFGEIAYCEIFRDSRMQRSRGFASVHFFTSQAASECLRKLAGAELRGQRLSVCALEDHGRIVSVFVGSLPAGTSASDVEETFECCGRIARCTLLRAEGRVRPKEQARIDFVFPRSVQEAVKQFNLREGAFRGSTIVVAEWQEDADYKRVSGPSVFLAKLDPATSQEEVWELFEGIGLVVVDVLLFRNKDSAESHTLGKVELGDQESCKLASEKLHGTLFRSNKIIVRESLREQLHPPATARRKGASPAVFVSGLGREASAEGLRAHFAGRRGLGHCRVFTSEDGTPRGMGKVEFSTEEQRNQAIEELQGAPLDGCPLTLRPFSTNLRTVRSKSLGCEDGGGANGRGGAIANIIYVGGLSIDTTIAGLMEHFAACGRIVHAQMMAGREGRSKRTAQITFAEEEGARTAFYEMNGSELDGVKIQVQESINRLHGGGSGTTSSTTPGQEHAVYVVGLGPETSLEALSSFLEQCGPIVDGHLLMDKFTGRPRGSAKITFESVESMHKAINEMHGQTLNGDFLAIRQFFEDGPPHGLGPPASSPDNAVFVSCLYPHTTPETLSAHFQSCGRVLRVSTGKSIGFGEVFYADRASKLRALKELNGSWLEGRSLVVSAYDPMKEQGSRPAGDEVHAAPQNVFVVGLDACTTSEELKEHFEVCGPVLYAHLMLHKESGQPLGMAKVAFASETSRWRAINNLDGSRLHGRTLHVREFLGAPQQANRWSPGERKHSVSVSGLSLCTTVDDFVEHFACCGDIVNGHMDLDRETGKPRGTGRIVFAASEGQLAAVAERHGSELDGSVISVVAEGLESGKGFGADGSRFSAYVAGFDPSIDGATLAKHFAQCGELQACQIFFYALSGESKCSGKVSFVKQSSLARALALNGSTLNGCPIVVRHFGRLESKRPAWAVFIMGLYHGTTNESLRRHFEEAGVVLNAFVMKNTFATAAKCLGKVVFLTEAAQQFAIRELNGSMLDGYMIVVREFKHVKGKGKGGPICGDHLLEDLAAERRCDGADATWRGQAELDGEEGVRKVDPEDGKVYTLTEILDKYRVQYSHSEVREYWASTCTVAPGAPKDMTVGDWLAAVDPGLLTYREAIERSYASLEGILSAHASTSSIGVRRLEAGFFELAGIARIAHKRLINKWIGEMT